MNDKNKELGIILLVEDNEGDALLAQEALKEGGIKNTLYHVKDGLEALQFLNNEGEFHDAPRPDVIFLDLNMPRMDGREFLTAIKDKTEFSSIPVIVLTTSQSELDISQTYNLNANCYIPKPVDFEQFVSVIHCLEHFWFTVVNLPSQLKFLNQRQGNESIIHLTLNSAAKTQTAYESSNIKRRGTVLLIEDNDGEALLVKEAIEASDLNTLVTRVSSGVEALDYLYNRHPFESESRPDLILLDINMPEMDGLEFLESIQKDQDIHSIPIVMLTVSQHKSDIERSYANHVNCFITKPVDLNEFLEVVKVTLDFWFKISKLP